MKNVEKKQFTSFNKPMPNRLDFKVCTNRLNCMLKICCVEAISKIPTLKP